MLQSEIFTPLEQKKFAHLLDYTRTVSYPSEGNQGLNMHFLKIVYGSIKTIRCSFFVVFNCVSSYILAKNGIGIGIVILIRHSRVINCQL